MNYDYVMDAYAWIEYFAGSEKGEKINIYIGSSLCTPSIVIAELRKKLRGEIRKGNETRKGMEERLEFVAKTSAIVGLDYSTALKAGDISFEKKKQIKGWGMADSIILATAKSLGAKVITGDQHFKNEKDAVLL